MDAVAAWLGHAGDQNDSGHNDLLVRIFASTGMMKRGTVTSFLLTRRRWVGRMVDQCMVKSLSSLKAMAESY